MTLRCLQRDALEYKAPTSNVNSSGIGPRKATMKLPFTTLDVFTTTPFSGNPVAVVRVPASCRDALTEEQKQKIATEFNLSEITFLHEASEGDNGAVADYDIFTARSRMTFAGHPTIGTAIFVSTTGRPLFPSTHSLRTLAGTIPLAYNPSTATASVHLPHAVHEHSFRPPHPQSLTSSSSPPTVPIVSIVRGMAFCLVPLPTLEALAAVDASLVPVADAYQAKWLDAGSGWDVGFTGSFYYVDLGLDYDDQRGRRLLRTRSIGTREDPGTGSASAALCCYLALREDKGKGRGPFEFHLVQGVEMGRRCDVFVRVVRTEDGGAVEEVVLTGSAVEVMEGVVRVE
ncbi:phenazine biosynthesis protein [Diplodia corticola]|uniref:Phenazine biosynthesis protein n=1 Tax=Diplodia corticola TaxID=236234 RepID=A0A1J9R918_9PEZI|nr:phenazine biosynthesis protein [Diplodia corticola]OJD36666.1 phenazine biosynthesis protein [Diplodia corticola]